MSTPYYQNVDPQPAPDPITPQASPSDPAGYASVTPHGQGTAPYNIQDGLDALQAEITAGYVSAGAVAGAGIVYPQGPRQAETESLLSSPAGYGAQDITAGYAGGGGDSWPGNPNPIPTAETPIQGSGDFTGTGTD